MALRARWSSRTLAMRNDSRWAGTAGLACVGAAWGALASWNSRLFMAGLLPRGGRKALGDDQAEHHQDFLAPGQGQARPQWGHQARCRGLRTRGGTRGRRLRDMVILLSVHRGVPGPTGPASATQLR